MSPGADAHSRLVSAAKFVLPIAGIALLSSLFLLAGIGERAPSERLPQAEGVAAERRLSDPIHAGVTEGGDAIELSASVARPDPADPRRMEAETLRAHIVTPEGSDLVVTAPRGRIDTAAGEAVLEGTVRVEGVAAEAGALAATAEGMRFDLGTGRGESAGPVEAEAAMGRIEAGTLTTEGRRLLFDDGVRLLLAPGGGAEE